MKRNQMKRRDCLFENSPSQPTTELKMFLFISTGNVQANAEKKDRTEESMKEAYKQRKRGRKEERKKESKRQTNEENQTKKEKPQ